MPRNWISGELITEDQWNTHINDNLAYLCNHTHGASAGSTVAVAPAPPADFSTLAAAAAIALVIRPTPISRRALIGLGG